jgi:hypothetical protein
MSLPVKEDKLLDPADIRLLRPHTIMPYPDGLPDLVEQLGLLPTGSASHPTNTLE